MSIKFGIKLRRKTTGADLYVYIQQFSAIVSVLYIVIAAGYMKLLTTRNVLSFLFDVGISTLPRAEALAVSWIYRMTSSEILVCFLLCAIGLVLGLIARRLFHDSHRATSKTAHIVFAVLIFLDLIVRLLPFEFNRTFGAVPAIIGFILRLGSLALIVLDLVSDRKAEHDD